jgi:hypothetical protein
VTDIEQMIDAGDLHDVRWQRRLARLRELGEPIGVAGRHFGVELALTIRIG